MKKLLILLGLVFCISANAAYSFSAEGAMYYNNGLDYYKNGEYTKAIEAFKQAVAKEPNFVDAYYNMGSIYEYLKSYQSAISCFAKINQLEPNDSEIIVKLGELYAKAGDWTNALSYADKVQPGSEFYSRAQALKQQSNNAIKQERERQELAKAKAEQARQAQIKQQQQQAAQAAAKQTQAQQQAQLAKQQAAAKQAQAQAAQQAKPQQQPQQQAPAVSKGPEPSKNVVEKFSGPTGIAMDSKRNLYVASYTDNSIYKITNGQSQLFSKSSLLGGPIGLTFDDNDNMYVANYDKNNILRISKNGQAEIFLGKVIQPYYLVVSEGYLYVSEQGSNTVMKYKLY